jgi:hypothetical protein
MNSVKKEQFNSVQCILLHLQIYKLIATGHKSYDEDCSEVERENHIMLLTRAKDALYHTLDRLRGDRLHVCINNKEVLQAVLMTAV